MNLSTSDILNIAFIVLYLVIVVLYTVILPRLPKNVQDQVRAVAADVVPFVEQRAANLNSAQKFDAAAQRVTEIMRVLGFKSVPMALIETAIEAAVYDLNRATEVVHEVQAAQPVPADAQTPPTITTVPPVAKQ